MSRPISKEPQSEEILEPADLAGYTGGVDPSSIEPLRNVADLGRIHPLLRALLGRGLCDFLVRAAALETIIGAVRGTFQPAELQRLLGWLVEPHRSTVLSALRGSEWLSYEPSIGYRVTDLGFWVDGILAFLHGRAREKELRVTLTGIVYLLDQGEDPIRLLENFEGRLMRLRDEIDEAQTSYSERILREKRGKIEEVIEVSQQVRAVNARIPSRNRAARNAVRRIHRLLAELHGAGSELELAISELGRQYLTLAAGLTSEQVCRALLSFPQGELASLVSDALYPILPPPPLINSDALARAALRHIGQERLPPEPFPYLEPEPAPRTADVVGVEAEVTVYLEELATLASAGEAVSLREIVPRHTPGESFLRLSLLPLVGDESMKEGVAGQLGRLPLEVDSVEGPPERLEGKPIRTLTKGTVRARGRA